MRPRMHEFGVTRLAAQTGLDRIGIPTVSAVRPNGLMISAHQGKGCTQDQALISALMEAVEVAVAERPMPSVWTGTGEQLSKCGRRHTALSRLSGQATEPQEWVEATSLDEGQSTLVPKSVVNYRDPGRGIVLTTNGLASSSTADGALSHAICELVETDAEALFSIAPDYKRFDPGALGDPRIDILIDLIDAADVMLVALDLTTDIGIPVVMAILVDRGAAAFPTAYGLGCDLSAADAACAAILEAAQTRVTNIAGSRDDFLPSDYTRAKRPGTDWPSLPIVADVPRRLGPVPEASAERVCTIIDAVLARGADLCSVQLSSDPDFSVVRVLSDTLEDRSVNPRWRPGRRAFAALKLVAA